MKQASIPSRKEASPADCWDLTSLYADDAAWEEELKAFSKEKERSGELRSLFEKELTAESLGQCLAFYSSASERIERLYVYAHLKQAADESDPENQDMAGRAMMEYSAFSAEFAWLIPAIQQVEEAKLIDLVKKIPDGERLYGAWLKKLIHIREHVLSEREERILALLQESSQTPKKAFSALTNTDLDLGSIETPEGNVPLTQGTWSKLMEHPSRDVRKAAYKQFYAGFAAHQRTIAALYAGCVNGDVASARIRGYSSSRAEALFPDNVPEAIYDNLVATVSCNLAPLHKYYAIRKRALGLDELRHYDVYVPLVKDIKRRTPYEEAVQIVKAALSPLGEEYTETLAQGLLGGWVDRYENKGKRSGAFSSGAYTGYPYILLNYKEDVLRDVFTMAHEGGHSMHTLFSARSNPYLSYEYTIFEAEVASTFNEDLLFRYLLKNAESDAMRAYLLCHRAGDIVATLYRQTMFAEFEHRAHVLVEGGTPLTAELLRGEYRKLLVKYFGPEMVFEEESDLEGLRIPHFYSSYYVYKYATGISASMALAERVCCGGKAERDAYFSFLKSGGSRYPIDALRVAGVDMESPAPVQAACDSFVNIIEELDSSLQLKVKG